MLFWILCFYFQRLYIYTLFKYEVFLLCRHDKRNGEEQLPNQSSLYTHLYKLATQTQTSEAL